MRQPSATFRARLVLSILRGETSGVEAARQHGIALEDIERWRHEFIRGGEEALGVPRYSRWSRLLQPSTGTVLGAIVVLAIVLRAVFFVGLVSGDPQDDGIYYGHAFDLFNEGPKYLERYRSLPPDFLANPIDQFDVRPLITYPIAANFLLFGPGEWSAAFWGFICSVLSVLAVYRCGSVMHDSTVGLTAALLCSFYPLEVINGTRILSDVQVGLCSTVGVLLLVEGLRQRSVLFPLLAGAAAAGAYLANGRGLVIFIALVSCATLLWLSGKTHWRTPASVVLGFGAIFGVEALVYYWSTGDFLLSYHIHDGAARYKYLHEPVSSVFLGRLHVRYTNGEPLELVRSVFRLTDGPTNQFGYFFFLIVAAVLFSLARRRNLLLVGLVAGLFAYFEFGPVHVSFDWHARSVDYLMVFKQDRFLLMLTAPALVLSAYLLNVIRQGRPIIAAALAVTLFVTSLSAIARTRNYYRAGLRDLRIVSDQVRSRPDRTFFGDFWAIWHLKIFTHYQAQNLKVLDSHTTLDDVRHACLMVGGSRGVELLSDYVEATLPVFARDVIETGVVPPDWTVVEEIKGERNPQRRTDLKVFCLP